MIPDVHHAVAIRYLLMSKDPLFHPLAFYPKCSTHWQRTCISRFSIIELLGTITAFEALRIDLICAHLEKRFITSSSTSEALLYA